MMEGTYYKEWSAVLDREMEFKVYGHGGVPVLALPARGGRFYDWENNGMPDAAARLLHEGKIQLFCADSIDGESLLAGNESPRRRAEMQEKYFVYLTSELAARIAELNAPESKEKPLIWCVGVDTGAYQAVQCRLRRPRTFAGAMGLSGLYDMGRFLGSAGRCPRRHPGSGRHPERSRLPLPPRSLGRRCLPRLVLVGQGVRDVCRASVRLSVGRMRDV